MNPLTRAVMRWNAKNVTNTVVTIPLHTVDRPEEEVVSEIERYRTTYA